MPKIKKVDEFIQPEEDCDAWAEISIGKSKKLGRGIRGKVYKLCDNACDRYALKIFRQNNLADFENEVRILTHLRDTDLPLQIGPIIYDAFGCEGKYYLIMEQFTGKTLGSMLQKGKKIKRAHLKLLGQKIKEMHQAGIVHGDLHLNNIVFDKKDKEFYLIDFDLADFGDVEDIEDDIDRDIERIKTDLALLDLDSDALKDLERLIVPS